MALSGSHMRDRDEIEAIVHEYIRDNLTVDVEQHRGYYGGESVSVVIRLNGKVISTSDSITLKSDSY